MSSDSRSSRSYSYSDSGSDLDHKRDKYKHRNRSHHRSARSRSSSRRRRRKHGRISKSRSRDSRHRGHSRTHSRSRHRGHSRHSSHRNRDRSISHSRHRHKSRSRTHGHRDRFTSPDRRSKSRPNRPRSKSYIDDDRHGRHADKRHISRDRDLDDKHARNTYLCRSRSKDDFKRENSDYALEASRQSSHSDSLSPESSAKKARLAKFQQLHLNQQVDLNTGKADEPEKKKIWSRVKSFFSSNKTSNSNSSAVNGTNDINCDANGTGTSNTNDSVANANDYSIDIPEFKRLKFDSDNVYHYVCDDEKLLKDFESASMEVEEDPLDAYMAKLDVPQVARPKALSVSWEDIQRMNSSCEEGVCELGGTAPPAPLGDSQAGAGRGTSESGYLPGPSPEHGTQNAATNQDTVNGGGYGGSASGSGGNATEDGAEESDNLFIKILKNPLNEDQLDRSDDEDDQKIMEIHKQSKIQFYTEIAGKVKVQKKLEPIDKSTAESLPPFQKDFYVECKEIASLADHEVSSIRKTNGNIKVRGKGCPRPIVNFAQCGLPDEILRILEKRDYEKPFPVQMQCIPCIMSGKDLVGVAQTGSGKTLAYILPLIRHVMAQPKLLIGDGCIALVIVPTRELAVQINREAMKFARPLNLVSTAVYGGTGIGDQLNALKRGSHIVVGTPGRLIDVLTISNGKVTNLKRTTFVVLDEADRMFDLGFAPQVQAIIDNTRPDRQTCLFSATFPAAIEMLAKRILTDPVEVTVGKKGAGANKVEQHVLVVKDEKEKLFKLLKLLGEWNEHGKIIIFVNKQTEADNLFVTLLKYGYHSYTLHGGQDQTDRTFTLQDFKDPRVRNGILISTSVASRGLDVKQVVLVINYNTPGHLEDYVHRVGRTGRAGNVGVAYTLVLPSDAPKTPDIVKALEYSNQPVPHELQSLCDAHLLATESVTNIPMKTDKNSASVEIKRRKPKLSGGFGGKGYKFDQSEMSLQQRQRKEATKVVDEITEEEKARLEEDLEADEPELPKPKPTQPPKHFNSGPDPTLLYLNANTSTGGIIVDEFQINKYSEAVRSKVTNRDVLLRISEDTGTRLQVKGHYLNPNAQNTIVYSGFVTSTFGLKPLYVEINGPSPLHIHRAKTELKNLIEAINETAPPTIPQFRTVGKYSVL